MELTMPPLPPPFPPPPPGWEEGQCRCHGNKFKAKAKSLKQEPTGNAGASRDTWRWEFHDRAARQLVSILIQRRLALPDPTPGGGGKEGGATDTTTATTATTTATTIIGADK